MIIKTTKTKKEILKIILFYKIIIYIIYKNKKLKNQIQLKFKLQNCQKFNLKQNKNGRKKKSSLYLFKIFFLPKHALHSNFFLKAFHFPFISFKIKNKLST